MGLEPPQEPPEGEYEKGDDFLPCWDAGKTPKSIRVSFAGLVLCPGQIEPPGFFPGSIICEQSESYSNIWLGGEFMSWVCTVNINTSGLIHVVLTYPFTQAFNGTGLTPCDTTVLNAIICNSYDYWSYNGTASVSINFTAPPDPNMTEAFALTQTLNISPPRATYKASNRITNSGKFEPDHNIGAASRTMVLAHWFDKTNILIKYTPADLPPPA